MRCTNAGSCSARRISRMKHFCNAHDNYFGSWFADTLMGLAYQNHFSPIDVLFPEIIKNTGLEFVRQEALGLELFRREFLDIFSRKAAMDWAVVFIMTFLYALSIPGLTRSMAKELVERHDRDSIPEFFRDTADFIERSYGVGETTGPKFTSREMLGWPVWEEMSYFVNEFRRLQTVVDRGRDDDDADDIRDRFNIPIDYLR